MQMTDVITSIVSSILNVNLDFDMYFANSMSTIVAQYRINL